MPNEERPQDTKKREPGCECHIEEGDSPCIVHGLYEAEHPDPCAGCARLSAAIDQVINDLRAVQKEHQ